MPCRPACLLYGASLIYGFAGTVSFIGIAQALQGHQAIGVIFGLVFLSAGLAFKMSAVPFHMWTPDVYQGAPTPVTAFFATAPKMAAVAITVRVIITAFPGIQTQWQQIIVFISIASMLLGSFAAIGQRNFKRLMAYSAIGNMGFALTGLAAGTEAGVYGVLIYMSAYLIMTLGTFAAMLSMQRKGRAVETVDDLAGLGQTNPAMAFFLAMIMFSLAGVPPLAGFFAKFYVFQAAIQANLYWLAVIGVSGQRRGGLLLPAHRQDDVFRCAGRSIRSARPGGSRRAGHRWPGDAAVLGLPGPRRRSGLGGSAILVLRRDRFSRARARI